MKRSEIAVIAAAVIVSLSFIFMMSTIVSSSLDKISSANFDSRMEQLKAKQKEVDNLKAAYEEWKSAGDSIKEFRKQEIMAFRKFPSFNKSLKSAINGTGLRIESMQNKITSTKKYDFVKVIVKLNLKGHYRSYKTFINKLNTFGTLVILRNMELQKGDNMVEGNINLEVCFDRRS